MRRAFWPYLVETSDVFPDEWEFPTDWRQTLRFLQSQHQLLSEIPDTPLEDDGTITLPVLPLRGLVVFPGMVAPMWVGRPFSKAAVDVAMRATRTLLAVPQVDPEKDYPNPEDLYPIGVEIAIGEPHLTEDGTYTLVVQGRRRVRIVRWVQVEPYFLAQAQVLQERRDEAELEVLERAMRHKLEQVVQMAQYPQEVLEIAGGIPDVGTLADMIASGVLRLSYQDLLDLLGTLDVNKRVRQVLHYLAREIEVLQLEEQIQNRVREEMERAQREAYLREQMRAIQNELGEGDFWQQELAALRERIEKAKLTEEARKTALREWERLSQMPPMSPEVGIVRNYIEWILELPWTEKTEDNLDLKRAARILDETHYGLPRAKERVLEYIAVLSLKPRKNRQPILCFVGPPGTGKTSLGQSIARALGRKFVRVSLGGVRDEAEIRGHRRTYIGALPGRILQTMRRAGTINPVFMLDEIDKLGTDFRGDPASALLEVLDPEQNHAFSDHYLEIPYDLSHVFFITTANTLSTIPPALLDRMEVIEFPGYVEEEKVEIAKRFLIPRQLEENGLQPGEVTFTEKAIRRIIREYTYEAGVRNLERMIARICRKIARMKAEGRAYPVRITPRRVEELLGPPQNFSLEALVREDDVGVALALAWTESGGDILPVEVAIMEGKGNLQITGQVGEVMQESAQAALSYIRSRARQYGLRPDIFEKKDIHLHVPEGSVPKDGPSAGVAIAVALLSALTGRKVRHTIGMTGEITLRGRVIPVGGIREKVLAAHRAGLKTVLLPEPNLKDLVDVPKGVRDHLNIVPITHLEDALQQALYPPKETEKARARRTRPGLSTAPSPGGPQ